MLFLTYIFDFDGTLVDSMPTWIRKVFRVIENAGVDYPDDIIRTITPLGDVGAANYLREVLGVRRDVNEIIAEMNSYAIPEYEHNVLTKPGVVEYLCSLKEKKASINILTASPREMVIPCLIRNGIYEFFDNVWSCEEFGKTKSDPQLYYDVLDRLGTAPRETVFFDDNINAVKAASAAELYVVGVFDDSGLCFKDEMKLISDMYIDSFKDAPNI